MVRVVVVRVVVRMVVIVSVMVWYGMDAVVVKMMLSMVLRK